MRRGGRRVCPPALPACLPRMLDVIAGATATVLCHEVPVNMEIKHQELLVRDRTERDQTRTAALIAPSAFTWPSSTDKGRTLLILCKPL